jgi:hypothetical protein
VRDGHSVDVLRRPQHMWIINAVRPVSALFGSVLAVWGKQAM